MNKICIGRKKILKIFFIIMILVLASGFLFSDEKADTIDSDKDGLTDKEEEEIGTDPYNTDSDGDSISDSAEVKKWETDPLNSDTDGDGYTDDKEILSGTDPTENENEETDSDEVEEELEYKQYRVEIGFHKGTKVKGIISIAEDSIVISNEIDGLYYEKKINFIDVKSIEVLEWNPYMSSISADSSNEIEYTFYPSKYKLKLNDGTVYYQKHRFKNIEVLDLENHYGKTRIYMIFIDYWQKKAGEWLNSGLTAFEANNKNPNPLTANKIDILGLVEVAN